MRVAGDVERIRIEGLGLFLAVGGIGAEALAAAIDAHRRNADPSLCLKRNRGTLVTRVPIRIAGGAEAVEAAVKESPLAWRRRVLRPFGVASRFAREFESARRLRDLGIPTPAVIAASLRPPRRTEFLITEYIRDGDCLRDLLWSGARPLEDAGERSSLLFALGRWLRLLHDTGIWQRDMKTSNVILRRGAGDPTFVLLDITGIRFHPGPLDRRRRVRNLSQALDLPAALDSTARAPLLDGYLRPDAEGRGRWERAIARAIDVRRARRRRVCGFPYVDEERRANG